MAWVVFIALGFLGASALLRLGGLVLAAAGVVGFRARCGPKPQPQPKPKWKEVKSMKLLELFANKPWWFKALAVYFALFGASGFMMFVFEEAMQTQQFAAFVYMEANAFKELYDHLRSMRSLASLSKLFIYGLGWLNPLMQPAFIAYMNSYEAYIKAAKARVCSKLQYLDGCH